MALPWSELDQESSAAACALAGSGGQVDLAIEDEHPRALVDLVLSQALPRREVQHDRTSGVARGEDLGQPRLEVERCELPAVHRSTVVACMAVDAIRCANMAGVEQRVSLITLGVGDLARARAFYEKLGWHSRAEPDSDVVFFQAGGLIVSLWDRDKLAHDSGIQDSGGWGGITLAYNVESRAAVDAVLVEAATAGARIARGGAETFWGGYSGLFVDPDGHPWEVAHNPHWTFNHDGSVMLAP